jgi:hypothetical protein
MHCNNNGVGDLLVHGNYREKIKNEEREIRKYSLNVL